MENYVGKICPFCKTEIGEEDSVKVCQACGIPHHEGCWEENKGCTTFGCSEQHYEAQGTTPTDVCTNCGTALGDGQMFCPNCGTPKSAQQKNICSKCGEELRDGQVFCPNCGQKAGVVIEADVNAAIGQFNSTVKKTNANNKKFPIIIAAVLAVVAVFGFIISSSICAKKVEEARDKYISNAEAFLELAITAGSNLENIADTIQTYWYENIWEDKHGKDIDSAILYAMIDKSAEISEAEEYDSRMQSLFSNLKKIPKEVSEDDVDDLEDLRDAVKDLYNVYTDYYSLATDPSGSYNSYRDNNSELTDEFLSCYRALSNLLN